MKEEKLSTLVGKSFEELSIEEMNAMQGAQSAGAAQINSSAGMVASVIFTSASAALSGQLSKAVSSLVTAAKNCK